MLRVALLVLVSLSFASSVDALRMVGAFRGSSVKRKPALNVAPFPGVCEDLLITAPATSGVVSCTAATDNDLPPGSTGLTYAWTFETDCPGTEVFSDATVAEPTISQIWVDGTCTVRRTACDGQVGLEGRECRSDDLTLTRVTLPSPGELSLTATEINLVEGVGVTFDACVTRTNGSQGTVGATLTASEGTATDPEDYTHNNGTVSFGDGVTSNQCRTYTITNDAAEESTESFAVTLGSPTGGATLIAPTTLTVTITDDDASVAMVNIVGGSWTGCTSFTFSSSSSATACDNGSGSGGSCAITYTLSGGPYTCGQYLNGDPWVVDPGSGVTISSITPTYRSASGSQRNGQKLNPSAATLSSYNDDFGDARNGTSFKSAAVTTTPIVATAPSSIVKYASEVTAANCQGAGAAGTVDGVDDRSCIRQMGVMTVVSSQPASSSFRPPHSTSNALRGTTFTYTVGREAILPGVANTDAITRETAERYVGKTRVIPYKNEIQSDRSRPEEASTNWAAAQGALESRALLWAMTDDATKPERRGVIFGLIQTGIDSYGLLADGFTYSYRGGNGQGHMLPTIFAATMLQSNAIRNSVSCQIGECSQTFVSSATGKALYGDSGQFVPNYCRWAGYIQQSHENVSISGCPANMREVRDPHGYFDGPAGLPFRSYGNMVNGLASMNAIAMDLMPELYATLDASPQGSQYVDMGRRARVDGVPMADDQCKAWPDGCTGDPRNCSGWGTTFGPVGGGSSSACVIGSPTRASKMTSTPNGFKSRDPRTSTSMTDYFSCSRTCPSGCSGMVGTPIGC